MQLLIQPWICIPGTHYGCTKVVWNTKFVRHFYTQLVLGIEPQTLWSCRMPYPLGHGLSHMMRKIGHFEKLVFITACQNINDRSHIPPVFVLFLFLLLCCLCPQHQCPYFSMSWNVKLVSVWYIATKSATKTGQNTNIHTTLYSVCLGHKLSWRLLQ